MPEMPNDWKATVVAVDLIQVYILCPYCGEVHMHGSNGIIEDAEYGHRVAHCHTPNHGGYYLVCNPFTIRSEAGLNSRTVLRKYQKALGTRR